MGAIAQCATKEPAEMAALEFPGWTLLFDVAELFVPAGNETVFSAPLINQQEVDLPLNVRRDGSPSLLVAVYCFQRHPEEF